MNISLIMKIALLVFVYALVIGGTYPIRREAVEEHKINAYFVQTDRNLDVSRAAYDKVMAGPHTVDEAISAREPLINALRAKQLFPEAIELYQKQMGETWGLVSNAYNPRWVETCRKLAAVHRDALQLSAAIVCYKDVYEHDKKYLPANDVRLVRDLNNMGVITYFDGTGEEAGPKRTEKLELAEKYLKEALTANNAINLKGTPREASILANLFLVTRDLGKAEEAEGYKRAADHIDAGMKRVCVAP